MSKIKLARNVGSMSVAVLISRLFGLLRDVMLTGFFGTTYVADAFQVAFQIPNLLRKLFGEGALSAAFIPIYNEIKIKQGREVQIKFGLNVLSILSLFLTVLCLLGIVLAPLLVGFLAPGFEGKTFDLTVKLTRLLFPYLFLIGMSSTLIAILNSHDYFFIPGLSSAFLNIGMVGCLGVYELFWSGTPESRIWIWSIGVIAGGVMQTAVNLPLLKKLGYKLSLKLSFKGEALTAMWKRFIPGVVGLAIREVNLAVDLILASLLATGSIAALNYGNRLMLLPLGIFGVSAGVAVLPLFSRNVAEKNWTELQSNLRFSIISLSYIMLPITALMMVLGKDIIRLIFFRGAFNEASLSMTSIALYCYSSGLLFYSLNRIIIPIFYANKDTKTPVKISALIVALNITLNIILMRYMQHAGLALATAISAAVHTLVLLNRLKAKIPELKLKSIWNPIFKIAFLSGIIYLIASLISLQYEGTDLLSILLRSSVIGIFSFVILIFGSNAMKITYSHEIQENFLKRFRK